MYEVTGKTPVYYKGKFHSEGDLDMPADVAAGLVSLGILRPKEVANAEPALEPEATSPEVPVADAEEQAVEDDPAKKAPAKVKRAPSRKAKAEDSKEG